MAALAFTFAFAVPLARRVLAEAGLLEAAEAFLEVARLVEAEAPLACPLAAAGLREVRFFGVARVEAFEGMRVILER